MDPTADFFHPSGSSSSTAAPTQPIATTTTMYNDYPYQHQHQQQQQHHHHPRTRHLQPPPVPPARTSSLRVPTDPGSSLVPSVQIIQPTPTKLHKTRRKSATSFSSNEYTASPKTRQSQGQGRGSLGVKVDSTTAAPPPVTRGRIKFDEEEEEEEEDVDDRVKEEQKNLRAKEKGRERQRRKRERDKRAKEVCDEIRGSGLMVRMRKRLGWRYCLSRHSLQHLIYLYQHEIHLKAISSLYQSPRQPLPPTHHSHSRIPTSPSPQVNHIPLQPPSPANHPLNPCSAQ